MKIVKSSWRVAITPSNRIAGGPTEEEPGRGPPLYADLRRNAGDIFFQDGAGFSTERPHRRDAGLPRSQPDKT